MTDLFLPSEPPIESPTDDVSPPISVPVSIEPSTPVNGEAKTSKPEPPVQEIIDFAISFSSLGKLPQHKLRLRSSVGDLLHTMGYYAEQVKTVKMSHAARLALIAEAIRYISNNLGSL